MSTDSLRESRAKEIFVQALDQPESDRLAFLESACGKDHALRERVDALLHAYLQSRSLFSSEGFAKNAREVLEAAVADPAREHDSGFNEGQRLSHYRLLEQIGEGGMGVVWRAEDTILHRTVAIKVLPPNFALDERRRRMFLDEARLAASLSHGNIVQVHELGQEDDLDFIVMEYVEGKPLRALLTGEPLRVDRVVDLGLQVAHGLARAHRKQLIHRDLKPANILVTNDGEVKIVDFGLATLYAEPLETPGSWVDGFAEVQQEMTRTAILGTLPYMSPEQVRREALDARSDIFSFGTVLYEMTTGRRPFPAKEPTTLVQQIQAGVTTPVRDVISDVPFELDRLIEKAQSPSPEDRYQTMDDLAVDLRRLKKDLETNTAVSSGTVRFAKRQYRIGTWSLAFATLILVASMAVAIWFRSERASGAAQTGRHGILVLPFDNLGPPEDTHVADRITAEIRTWLDRIPGVAVVSREAFLGYDSNGKELKEIAADLHADYVIQGNIRWERRSDSMENFTASVDLAKGEHIDFCVGDGGNGYNSDSSALAVTLTGPIGLSGSRPTYDAFDDYSLDGTTPWSYGYTSTLGGHFIHLPNPAASDSFRTWWSIASSNALPSITKNVRGIDLFIGGVLFDSSQFLMAHPGAKSEIAVLRFTAPIAGTYELSARFKNPRISGPGATTDVHVLAQNKSIFDGEINVAKNNQWSVRAGIVRARDGSRLWSQEQEIRLADIHSVAASLASEIVTELGVGVPLASQNGGPRSTESLYAHQAYVRGQRLIMDLAGLNQESWSLGIQLYERAIEHDPEFLLPYAGLAYAHAGFRHFRWDRSQERLQRAQMAAERAYELDPEAPETHVALGYYHCWVTRDLDRALAEFDTARRLWPDSAIVLMGVAEILTHKGEFSRSLDHLEIAVRSEPRNAMLLYRLAETYSFMRRYREAERTLNLVITFAPDAPSGYMNKANNAILQGQIGEAWKNCELSPPITGTEYASMPCWLQYHWQHYSEALDLARELPDARENQFGVISRPLMMATIYDAQGEGDSAKAAWSELLVIMQDRLHQDPSNPALHSALGLAYAGLGRKEDALREGTLALELTGNDMWERPSRVFDLMRMAILIDDIDAAVAQLQVLIPMPNNLVGTNLLRYSPLFDSVRKDPRFPDLLGLTF